MAATGLNEPPDERSGAEASPSNATAVSGTVWLRDEPDRARRAAPLTREQIVHTAVALLDQSGAGGLTMRRLAQELEVTATALYWHVKTKDDVLDLAVDRVFAEVAIPEQTDEWRADVRTLASRWREVMLAHPWAPALIGRPMLGPNVLARTEFLQSSLARSGLNERELTVRTRLLANFVIGSALTEATWHQASDPAMRTEARDLIAADPERYPTLTASGHLDEERWSDADLFECGLDALLADTGPTSPAAPPTHSTDEA
ncbi:transcriptional regulator, TetR family [Prauserella aidingensis]|uniref:TetR/AcrR family transcriptional regulator n=1 Tax=Prauserella aidingensis TaxID=387890 RepID=UPI0020A573A6|nr:TetR/AcrR family transcriptional regulator C-terminal domain-containing protein [Prauserella aidingensis]MCP2256199.1 transcriptional regulator, TetR family [Prauserella aidingensis]